MVDMKLYMDFDFTAVCCISFPSCFSLYIEVRYHILHKGNGIIKDAVNYSFKSFFYDFYCPPVPYIIGSGGRASSSNPHPSIGDDGTETRPQ